MGALGAGALTLIPDTPPYSANHMQVIMHTCLSAIHPQLTVRNVAVEVFG